MDLQIDDIVDAAEGLLSRRFGGTQQLSGIEELDGSGQSTVLRARVANSPFLPHRSVIVKHTPVTGSSIDDAALLREVVAYQFTNSLAQEVRPGPVLLAYDIEQRIVVLTDLGDSLTLVDVLHGADAEERVAVFRSLGGALGRLHAGTAGRDAAFDVLLRRLVKAHRHYAHSQALRDEALAYSIPLGLRIVAAAGLDVPEAFAQAAKDAEEACRSGAECAFTPFDLSPDNIISADRIHFLDFEWAGFRNVTFDVGSVISGFPQFVFAEPVADAEVETFLTAWTREIQDVWPNLAERDYRYRAITVALVGWALSSLATMAVGGLEPLAALVEDGADAHLVSGGGTYVSDALTAGIGLLRSGRKGEFTGDDRLVRQDLYESFEALARYATATHERIAEDTSRAKDSAGERTAGVAVRFSRRSGDRANGAELAAIARFAEEIAGRLAH